MGGVEQAPNNPPRGRGPVDPIHHHAEHLVFRTAGMDRHHHVVPHRAERVRLDRSELNRRIDRKVGVHHQAPTTHGDDVGPVGVPPP